MANVREHRCFRPAPLAGVGDRDQHHVGLAQHPDRLDRDKLRVPRPDPDPDQRRGTHWRACGTTLMIPPLSLVAVTRRVAICG